MYHVRVNWVKRRFILKDFSGLIGEFEFIEGDNLGREKWTK